MTKLIAYSCVEESLQKQLEMPVGHFLDSGDAYGRNYEKYQNNDLDKFIDRPEFSVDIAHEGIIGIYRDRELYPFLLRHLFVNETTKELTKQLYEFDETHGSDSPWLSVIEDWIKANEFERDTWYRLGTLVEENFNQCFDYTYFEFNNSEYIVLRTHNGCDIRGGYSFPIVYSVDLEEFEFEAFDPTFTIYTDNHCYEGDDYETRIYNLDNWDEISEDIDFGKWKYVDGNFFDQFGDRVTTELKTW